MTSISALNLIDGVWQSAQSGRVAPSIDPSSGTVLGGYAASGRIDAEAAVAAARRAFGGPEWAQNARLRQLVMLRWADLMESRGEQLARLLTAENGKPLAQSRGEIAGSVSEIRYYAGLTRYIPGHVFEVEPGSFSTLLKEPAGVAGLIIPWNAPAVLLIRALTPALAAGCTVVIKPAPQTALVTAEIIRSLHDIDGLPKGVVNLLSEDGHEVAQHLVTSPDVDVISFTGSNATGQRIMAAAAPTMKKLSLELGGKSACLVFEDADVADIAPKLAAAATIIAGQQCTAARRILVHASRYDEMKHALSAALSRIKIGPGADASSEMGPLIDEPSRAQVSRRIAETMEIADEVVLRGEAPAAGLSKGFFLQPTLVAHRDTSAFFIQEEIFGPLVVIEKFEDEKEAVACANHSEYGLSASVWTRDGARAMRVARALRNGTVWINDHNKLFAEAETGGYRRSGLGRLHGYDALVDFTEIKHIFQNCGVV
jgi:betaine-aldehyde dehydrogenase